MNFRWLKRNLLSSLAFHRNVYVTLLMCFNIGRFIQAVLLMLMTEMKVSRVEICQQLSCYENEGEEFCYSIVTTDKHYGIVTKWQARKYCQKTLTANIEIDRERDREIDRDIGKEIQNSNFQENSWLTFGGHRWISLNLAELATQCAIQPQTLKQ